MECQSRTAPPAAEAGGSSHSPAAEHAAARLPSRAGNTRSRGARSGSPRGRPGAAPLGPNEAAALPRSGPGAGGGTPGARSPSLAGPPPAAGSDWSSPPPRPAPPRGRAAGCQCRVRVPACRRRPPRDVRAGPRGAGRTARPGTRLSRQLICRRGCQSRVRAELFGVALTEGVKPRLLPLPTG